MGIPGSCNVLRVRRPVPGQDAVAGGPEARSFVRQGERLFQSGKRHKSVFLVFLGEGDKKIPFRHAHLGPVGLQKGYFQLGCENKSRGLVFTKS